MNILKPVVKFIEQRAGLVLGENLFAGFRPAEAPDECVVILDSSGSSPYELPDHFEKPFQILVRSTSFFRAYELAWSIFTKLHGEAGWPLPIIESGESYEAMTIQASSTPYFIGTDEHGLFEFSSNYIFRIRPT